MVCRYVRCTLLRPCGAGIGKLLGAWLTCASATVPVLLGRSGRFSVPPPTGLLHASRPVVAVRCDASTAEETAAALGTCGSDVGVLGAVLHAGGVLQDAMLPQQTVRSIRNVVAPKLCFLALAVRTAQLQAVHAVNLFSSVAAFIGSPGQANYAAANSSLDCWSLAMQQRGTAGKWSGVCRHFVFSVALATPVGSPALNASSAAGSSVQWGAWSGVGMAQRNVSVLARVGRSGMGLIQPIDGLESLQRVLAGSTKSQWAQVIGAMLEFFLRSGTTAEGNRGFALILSLHPSTMQTIASPFSFDRLFEGVHSVPYVFSFVAPPTQQPSAASLQDTHAKHTVVRMSPTQLSSTVQAKVHTVLGTEVSLVGWVQHEKQWQAGHTMDASCCFRPRAGARYPATDGGRSGQSFCSGAA